MIQDRGQDENIDPSFPDELRERYVDVRFVGKGGMGRVYFARDLNLNRFVAIKLLPHTTDNDSSVVRFHQEARAVSKLNNPHVVQVLDFGQTEDSDFFLVMEFIDGKDLEQIVKENGPFSVRDAIDIAIQICTALEHAHSNGVVHRDLKPANIMIDQENRARILDFGVAKVVDQSDTDHRVTRPGQAVGSVLYMSPEQLNGQEADARSDIFSVALLIYKICVGHLPHEDEKIMKLIRLRIEGTPLVIPPQAEDNDVIDKLNHVLSIALAPKAEDRYDNMTALQNALVDCLSSHSIEQPVSPRTKNAIQASAITACVCLLAAGLFFSFYDPTSSGKTQKSRSSISKKSEPPLVKPVLAPREKTSQGVLMPPGFSEEDDSGQIYWVAHDYITNNDLKSLEGSGVPSLSIQNNQNITKEGMETISTLTISALCIRDTKIGDESIDAINKLKLRSLNIRQSRVTEAGVLRLKPSLILVNLDLKYLPVTKKSLDHIIKSFPNLQSLNIGESKIRSQDLDEIPKLHNLSCLYLEGLGLHDKAVEKITKLDKLVRVEVADNPITDATVEYFLKKPKLEWVSFGSCVGISEKSIYRLRKRFPQGHFSKPVADKPPDDLNVMFFKEYE